MFNFKKRERIVSIPEERKTDDIIINAEYYLDLNNGRTLKILVFIPAVYSASQGESTVIEKYRSSTERIFHEYNLPINKLYINDYDCCFYSDLCKTYNVTQVNSYVKTSQVYYGFESWKDAVLTKEKIVKDIRQIFLDIVKLNQALLSEGLPEKEVISLSI